MIWAIGMVLDDCHVGNDKEWYGSLNQSHTKPMRLIHINKLFLLGETAPYQSHINQYLLHKLWKNYGTTMGKKTCTHSKPIPQLLTGGMQLLEYFHKGEKYSRK